MDLPRPPDTTAAVVTAPHSRAREAVGDSLVHVPLETFLETLESPGASGSNRTGAMGPSLFLPPSWGPCPAHRHPQAPPKPFVSLQSCDLSTPGPFAQQLGSFGFCRPGWEPDPSHGPQFRLKILTERGTKGQNQGDGDKDT